MMFKIFFTIEFRQSNAIFFSELKPFFTWRSILFVVGAPGPAACGIKPHWQIRDQLRLEGTSHRGLREVDTVHGRLDVVEEIAATDKAIILVPVGGDPVAILPIAIKRN